jgi:hypothetical protein
VHRISRLLLLIGLALGLGGRGAALDPARAAAQDAQHPPPKSAVKMPPPAAINTQGIAGQVVGVLPATLVVARDSLAGRPPFTDRAASNHWVDSVMTEALMLRAPEVQWKSPAQMRSLARQAPGIAADPDYLGQAALRDPQIQNVPDPMISNFRTLMAIAGGRYLFVPAALSFQHDSTGGVQARVNFVGVDTRMGTVVFRSYIVVDGPTPAGALDAAFGVLLPSVTVEP